MTFKVMLAHKYDPTRIKSWDEIYAEPKLDGVRVICTVSPDLKSVFRSRNGRELQMFNSLSPWVIEVARGLARAYEGYDRGVMFDGEMMDDSFGIIAGTIHRKDFNSPTARYSMFHTMPLYLFEAGADVLSQNIRRMHLKNFAGGFERITIPARQRVKDDMGVDMEYSGHRDDGFEGTMVKDYSQPWMGRRSYAWMKIKDELSVDVEVVDVQPGMGKYEGTLGALVVLYKGVRVPVSGMTDAQRHELWKNPPLGRMVEVVYQEETVHGSLRHPRFKRFRDDKQ